MGKFSRAKGARVERALRDELERHGWTHASREGWKQVRGGAVDSGDVIARTPQGVERWFECKARAVAFKAVYTLMNKHRVFDRGHLAWSMPDGRCVILAYDPNKLLGPLAEFRMISLCLFSDKEDKKVMKSIAGFKETYLTKRDKKTGKGVAIQADYLALKGDREPFIFVKII